MQEMEPIQEIVDLHGPAFEFNIVAFRNDGNPAPIQAYIFALEPVDANGQYLFERNAESGDVEWFIVKEVPGTDTPERENVDGKALEMLFSEMISERQWHPLYHVPTDTMPE